MGGEPNDVCNVTDNESRLPTAIGLQPFAYRNDSYRSYAMEAAAMRRNSLVVQGRSATRISN